MNHLIRPKLVFYHKELNFLYNLIRTVRGELSWVVLILEDNISRQTKDEGSTFISRDPSPIETRSLEHDNDEGIDHKQVFKDKERTIIVT